jgi:hypothetical protein
LHGLLVLLLLLRVAVVGVLPPPSLEGGFLQIRMVQLTKTTASSCGAHARIAGAAAFLPAWEKEI